MINLLPPDKLAEIRYARSNTVLRRYIELLIVCVILLLASFAGAQYFLSVQESNSKETLDINKAQVAKLEPVQKEAEQLSATVNTIASLQSRNIKFSDMLVSIGGVMPEGSVLTGLQFSIENLESPLVISARVDNEQTAAILRNNLAHSELFTKAEIQMITALEEEKTDSESATAVPESRYKYTASINAYFKKQENK